MLLRLGAEAAVQRAMIDDCLFEELQYGYECRLPGTSPPLPPVCRGRAGFFFRSVPPPPPGGGGGGRFDPPPFPPPGLITSLWSRPPLPSPWPCETPTPSEAIELPLNH